MIIIMVILLVGVELMTPTSASRELPGHAKVLLVILVILVCNNSNYSNNSNSNNNNRK